MSESIVLHVDSGEQAPEWPEGWPPPRVGDDVATDARWWTVESVVWIIEPEASYIAVTLCGARS